MTLQTEYNFVLPKGYVDDDGNVHSEGVMRLATVMGEITPIRDPRVRNNVAYLVIILLSQVITRIGTISQVTPEIIEGLFAVDIAYLQDLYQQINDMGAYTTNCPHCGHEFDVELPLLEES